MQLIWNSTFWLGVAKIEKYDNVTDNMTKYKIQATKVGVRCHLLLIYIQFWLAHAFRFKSIILRQINHFRKMIGLSEFLDSGFG